jgi:hypothetical protein
MNTLTMYPSKRTNTYEAVEGYLVHPGGGAYFRRETLAPDVYRWWARETECDGWTHLKSAPNCNIVIESRPS